MRGHVCDYLTTKVQFFFLEFLTIYRHTTEGKRKIFVLFPYFMLHYKEIFPPPSKKCKYFEPYVRW